MWPLSFISEDDFLKHVEATIQQYGEKLEPYDLMKFNSNIIDPVKLIFDKTVYGLEWDEIVKNEIYRQRDKSNNNDIGYFHQKVFRYIDNCAVPDEGWDVVFRKDSRIHLPDGDTVKTVYVEMKNKHNTMSGPTGEQVYSKMQRQLLADDDCACFLVQTIAIKPQNVTWEKTVEKVKQRHRRIRRVSIDQFYSLVTGQEDAFFQMCMALPGAIESVVAGAVAADVPVDTVLDELNGIAKSKDGPFALALYLLGFGSYFGFREKTQNYDSQGDGFLTVNEKSNNKICKECKHEFQWSNRDDIFPGGKDKEDIVCPYCGSIDGSIMTSGYIHTQKK